VREAEEGKACVADVPSVLLFLGEGRVDAAALAAATLEAAEEGTGPLPGAFVEAVVLQFEARKALVGLEGWPVPAENGATLAAVDLGLGVGGPSLLVNNGFLVVGPLAVRGLSFATEEENEEKGGPFLLGPTLALWAEPVTGGVPWVSLTTDGLAFFFSAGETDGLEPATSGFTLLAGLLWTLKV
jgi:hypothetical protein